MDITWSRTNTRRYHPGEAAQQRTSTLVARTTPTYTPDSWTRCAGLEAAWQTRIHWTAPRLDRLTKLISQYRPLDIEFTIWPRGAQTVPYRRTIRKGQEPRHIKRKQTPPPPHSPVPHSNISRHGTPQNNTAPAKKETQFLTELGCSNTKTGNQERHAQRTSCPLSFDQPSITQSDIISST